jgi:hypothetical protein
MSWTRQRVTILAAVIFAAHVAVIFALHTPRPMVTLPKTFRTPRLKSSTPPINALPDLDGLNDPLVFAGAHEHGFSASAWMMRPSQDYALTNSKPPPRFLAFARTPIDFPRSRTENPIHAGADLPFLDIALAPEPHRSILFVEGELQNRPLVRTPKIPIESASDVLTNTVIQVAVKADGFPFSARIITSSGSRAADLKGLDIANHLKFAPLPPAAPRDPTELQWGQCVFQWFTTEPGATNAASAPAGPNVTSK